jgi:hypothetical protein
MKLICAILFVLFAFGFTFMSYVYGSDCFEHDFASNKVNAQFLLSMFVVLASIVELFKLLFGKPEEE